MSRARHKRQGGGHTKGGGSTHSAGTSQHIYAGAGSPVMREAHARKHGGRVHEGEGEEPKHHGGRRARGGAVNRKAGGAVPAKKEGGSVIARSEGGAVPAKSTGGSVERKRGGRVAGRARGGAIGADKRPLSTAANFRTAPITGSGGHDHSTGPANEEESH